MSVLHYSYIPKLQVIQKNAQTKGSRDGIFKWYRRKAKEHKKDMNKFETI
jgi:hypothetical protein